MRKIKILTIMAGPGGCFSPGQIIGVEDDLAHALVAGGYGEYADGGRQEYETATAEPPENAMKKPPKRRKAGK